MQEKYNIIDEQIENLKLKGLRFRNEELAKEIILNENYYFLTYGYEEIFLNLKNTKSGYEDETYFEELYAIYNFDRELKNLIFDYINIVETKLKSYIAYEYIEKYGEEDLLKRENLDNSFKSNLKLDKIKKQVDENIENASKNNKDLQLYIDKDGYLKPLIMVKYFMFGNIINLYSIMKKGDKEKIASHFKQSSYVVEKKLKMLNVIRNICAHGGILFNFKYSINNLYSVMKVLKEFLDKDIFYNMFVRVENLLIYVRNDIDELSYNNLLRTMGFPINYKVLYNFEKEKNENMNYQPKPVDTKDVILSEEILKLAEKLANNTHDIWAIGRINEGWKYGTVRDDKLKTTPCLVPYEELPESEKEYDRNTAIETLKLIQKLGFNIVKEEK